MILALYKAAEYWKLSAGLKGFTLVRVLVEDQILYFVLYVFPLPSLLLADIFLQCYLLLGVRHRRLQAAIVQRIPCRSYGRTWKPAVLLSSWKPDVI